MGLSEVIFSVSLGSLIFSGPLTPLIPRGVGIALFSAAAMMIVTSFFSRVPGVIGSTQDTSSVILAVMAAGLASALAGADLQEIFITVLVAIAIATVLTGLFFTLLGTFKLGGFVRYVPYPVVGGFLAGTGWLLAQGSFSVMAGYPLIPSNFQALLQPSQLILWVPGVLFSLILFFGLRRLEHVLALPGILVGGMILFYLVLAIAGISIDQAAQMGLLFEQVSGGASWQPILPAELLSANWTAIFAEAANRLADLSQEAPNRELHFLQGKALLHQARFYRRFLGEKERSDHLFQACIELFKELSAHKETAYAQCYLGGCEDLYGGQDALPCLEALKVFRQINDPLGIGLALRGLAWVSLHQADYPTARRQFQESLEIFRQLNKREEITASLGGLGYTAWIQGEFDQAEACLREMLSLAIESGDMGGKARAIGDLAIDVTGRWELDAAKELFQQSLDLYREIGDSYGIADELGDLGEVSNMAGEHAAAANYAWESLAIPVKPGDWELRVLGVALCGLGDFRQARKYLYLALEQANRRQLPGRITHIIDAVGGLYAAEGDLEKGLELLALVQHHPASWQLARDTASRLARKLQSELAPEVMAAVQERGRSRDLKATIAELLEELAE